MVNWYIWFVHLQININININIHFVKRVNPQCVDTLVFSERVRMSLNKHATNFECTCANRALYFGVMVQCVCVCVRKAELFGMAPVSLSVLCLLLLDFQLGYGGTLCFVLMLLINNFSEV